MARATVERTCVVTLIMSEEEAWAVRALVGAVNAGAGAPNPVKGVFEALFEALGVDEYDPAKTPSLFSRYYRVLTDDLEAAAKLVDEYARGRSAGESIDLRNLASRLHAQASAAKPAIVALPLTGGTKRH